MQLVDSSLSRLIEHYVSQNNDKSDDEARTLKRNLGLPEQTYFTWVIKAYAQSKCFAEVSKFIKMGPKKCPVPLATIAEICFKEGNRDLARDAIM